jgi:heme exporter protein D
MAEFFSMGGYAAFVWPAYAITLIVLLWMVVDSVLGLRRRQAALDAQEEREP